MFSTENDSYVRAVAGSWGQHYSLIASIELNDNHSGMIRSTAYHHPGHAFDTESIPRLLPVVLGNLTEMLRVVLALELLVGIQNSWPRHLIQLQADVKKREHDGHPSSGNGSRTDSTLSFFVILHRPDSGLSTRFSTMQHSRSSDLRKISTYYTFHCVHIVIGKKSCHAKGRETKSERLPRASEQGDVEIKRASAQVRARCTYS